MEQIVIGMADCRVSRSPGQVLTTYALGSCVGLVIHDARAAVGGLLHFMLPDSGIDPAKAKARPFMFADTGIPLFLNQLFTQGADKRHLKVHVIGGARMMDQEGVFEIGKRNYLAARKILWRSGLLLASEVVGGMSSRTVRLDVGSGRIQLQESGIKPGVLPPAQVAAPAGTVAQEGGPPWATAF